MLIFGGVHDGTFIFHEASLLTVALKSLRRRDSPDGFPSFDAENRGHKPWMWGTIWQHLAIGKGKFGIPKDRTLDAADFLQSFSLFLKASLLH